MVIYKWIDGTGRKEEIAAQKDREEAAKDEEMPPQFNAGDPYRPQEVQNSSLQAYEGPRGL